MTNPVLIKCNGGHIHYCPGCKRLHILPNAGWTFNGSVDSPTFTPSFSHTWSLKNNKRCHYILTKGILNYCTDSTHELTGQSVPLEPLTDEDMKYGCL